MIKHAFFLLFMFVMVGCEGNGEFRLGSSLLGEFGRATVHSNEKGKHYSITINVKSTGIYNLVRGKRVEKYHSKGTIRRGVYYSQLFSIEKWANGKHTLTEYHFDYRRKKIMRSFRQWEKGKLTESVNDPMKYFGHDDFLTVMRNAIYNKPRTSGRRATVMVAGADNSQGKVPIYVSHDPYRLKQWGGTSDGTLIQAGVTKGIFDGGKGSMTVLLDAQNHPIKIVIKKVKIVNTVTGRPVKK
jgi:hypothetical protein